MLMPTQGAIHQPMAILNVEGEAADEGLLLFTGGDEVETILVFGVEHDVINPNSFEFVFIEVELKAQ